MPESTTHDRSPGPDPAAARLRAAATLAGPPAVRGRRRPWLIALGVLLATVGALGVVWLVGAAGQRVEVLVMRQEIRYGQPLTEDSVGVARVSVDPGVSVMPAADRDLVVGQVAATHLVAGALLAADMITTDAGPGAGQALVPLAIPSERMPAGGLQAGDRILAVDAGAATDVASATGGATRTYPATVVRVGAPDVNGTTVVDVTTGATDGPPLAVAAAHGQVAIVVQPRRG